MDNYLLQSIRTEKDLYTVTPGGINENRMVGKSAKKASFIKDPKFS